MIDLKTGLGLASAAEKFGKILAHYIFRGLKEVDRSIQPSKSNSRSIDFIFRNTYGSNIVIEKVVIDEPLGAIPFYRNHDGSIRDGELWYLQISTDIRHSLSFTVIWRPLSKLRDGDTWWDNFVNDITGDFGKSISLNMAQIKALPTKARQDLV